VGLKCAKMLGLFNLLKTYIGNTESKYYIERKEKLTVEKPISIRMSIENTQKENKQKKIQFLLDI
jgi:hypothetical protein